MITIKLGMVMDPIDLESGSFAILCEASKRGYQSYHINQSDLFIKNGTAYAMAHQVEINLDAPRSYLFKEPEEIDLAQLNVILMRKDPPVDMQFIYATHIVELTEKKGVLVVNTPQALRDANEKLFITHFPKYCPPLIVTNKIAMLKNFHHLYKEIVIKQLDSLSSKGIFYLRENDSQSDIIFQNTTRAEKEFVMAQKFLPEVYQGDRRLFIIDGHSVAPYAFLRIPVNGDFRGNLDSGAESSHAEMTAHEKQLVKEIGPQLRAQGLLFVSIDLIGQYISEINVTSIGVLSFASERFGISIPAALLNMVEKKLG